MARVNLFVLGGFMVRSASADPIFLPTRKSQGLLAYLALGPGHVHAREKLATLLWSDSAEAQARQSLRQALFDIRKAFARIRPEILRSNGDGVAVNSAAVEVDAVRFETLAAEGAPRALAKAVSLCEGYLLEGLRIKEEPWEEWLRAERARLHELRVEVLTRLLTHQTEAGATQAAIQTAGRLLALDPLHEAVHRRLMRLYLRQGRRAAALRQYQVCCQALERDLGVEPEAETRNFVVRYFPERVHRRAHVSLQPDIDSVARRR
ncbi:MAG: AfsR/SARP family transcriptional regulator [Candidatus Rokuibacteriota bacterium]